MELDNQAARQTYIKLLADILKRKTEVLEILLELTKHQENIIATEPLDEEEFLQIVTEKEEQINTLTKLDDGFEQLYQSVKEELATGREKYVDDIGYMKELIATITDVSVELQAREKRNKANMEAYFSIKRKDIRNSRASNMAVTNYYKNMTKQQASQSIFYDKKK